MTYAHGTVSRYKNRGCRCEDCRRANARWQKRWRVAQISGDPYTLPALGCARRLQALMAIGWSSRALAAECGLSYRTLDDVRCMHQPRVYRATAEAIVEVFDRLCMTPGRSGRSRTWARKLGYLPPLAWDDIDTDPTPATVTALPDVVDDVAVERACAGHHVDLTAAERLEVVRRLASRGVSDYAIAAVLRRRPESVQRLRARHGIPSTYNEMRTA